MSYQATVIPVMIASPGDVSEEREIIRATLHEWNDLNAEETKVVLAPVAWETHSSPELGARPQALINNRILRRCDLLIAVFWTRLGTPSGEADSGTVEEIERHVRAGRPAMIYFSKRPVEPASLDMEQWGRLCTFRDSLFSERRGLVEVFDTPTDFRKKLWHQLQRCLNENPHLKSQIPIGAGGDAKMLGIPSVRQTPPRLSDDATLLLQAAAEDRNGQILRMATLGGTYLIVNRKQLGDKTPRETARWKSALDEIVSARLAASMSSKNQVYELTHAGWSYADSLSEASSSP